MHGITGRCEGRWNFRHLTFASDDQGAARGVRQRHLQVLAGLLISWPFPNWTRVGTCIAAAQAESAAAYARFDGAVLTALSGTESGLTIYARDLDRVAVLRVASGRSGKAARNGETLFRASRTSFLPVFDAQHTAIGADQTLAAAESRLAADQVQIFLALGGGWQS
jgi:multidrug efflux system outer membrane protein